MNDVKEGLMPLDARQGEDVGASVVPDRGAVEVVSCWWHSWTRWYPVTDAREKRQERRCVKCNYIESAYIHLLSGGGL